MNELGESAVVARKKRDALEILCFLSVIVAAYDTVLYLLSLESGAGFGTVWTLVFGALVAMWVEADAYPSKPLVAFDAGLYFTLLWPVLLPYYLVRTRRWRGLPVFMGFAILFWGPFLALSAIYYFW